jgi:hypothetical protein
LNFFEFLINLLIFLPAFSLSLFLISFKSCLPFLIAFSAFLIVNCALLAVLFASFKSIPKFLNLLNSDVNLFINPSLLNFCAFVFNISFKNF